MSVSAKLPPPPGLSAEAVRALAQAGAQEAAAALGRMLDVALDVGDTVPADLVFLGRRHERHIIALAFETSGGLEGQLVFIADQKSAGELASVLIGPVGEQLGKKALQALAEVGNIAASAFLNGVARQRSMTCLPSVPRTSLGPVEQVLPATLPPKLLTLTPLMRAGNPFVDVVFV